MDGSKKNAYTILELEPSPDLDDAAIKKAYRRLAIVKHPDKNHNNPSAAEEFAELEQAYRLLLDKGARGALDDLLRAQAQRAARESAVSDKRRKLREDLERRERQSVSARSELEIARQRLKIELERLRRKAEEEERRQRQRAVGLAAAMAAHRAAAAASAGGGNTGASALETTSSNGVNHDDGAAAAMQAQLRRTLKVNWDPTCREYTSKELRDIFSGFGAPVQDVVLRDRKKQRKATALVVMGSEAAAAAAASSVCGDPSEPLLVVPLIGDGNVGAVGLPDGVGEGDCGGGPEEALGKDGIKRTIDRAGKAESDDGVLPRDVGGGSAASSAGLDPGSVGSLLQRPARLPDPAPAARPLFPTGGLGAKAAFPIPANSGGGTAGGGGLFPSAGGVPTGIGKPTCAAGGGTSSSMGGSAASSFPSVTGRPAFPSGVGRPAFPTGGATAAGAAGTFSSWRTSAATTAGVAAGGGNGNFEEEVLLKMRRAAAARAAAVADGGGGETQKTEG